MNDDQIPKGHYCYRIVKINASGSIEIKNCPYWEKKKDGARCNLLNVHAEEYSSESLIWDSVKECDINLDIEDED